MKRQVKKKGKGKKQECLPLWKGKGRAEADRDILHTQLHSQNFDYRL